jgi:hypothetical protein
VRGLSFLENQLFIFKTNFMGKYHQGVLGQFSGAVGPVIGSSWKGIGYMRGKSRNLKNRAVSPKIEIQRAKFKLAANFVTTIKDLLLIGFPDFKDKMTSRNNALSSLLQQAITGEYPDLRIEYSKVFMAIGSLSLTMNPAAGSTEPGVIKFTWKDGTGYGNAKATDKAVLIAFCEGLDSCYFIVSNSVRSAETASLDVKHFSGKDVHTWISFIAENGKGVATSSYTGLVKVA